MFAGAIIAGAMLGSFTCLAPAHDTATTVRCANPVASYAAETRSADPVADNADETTDEALLPAPPPPPIIRLMGIDAPAMPATCQPGDACPPGDPFAARDTLRSLTLGRTLSCEAAGTDPRGRILARCKVGDVDLSCAMLASGHAVPSKTAGDCNCATPRGRPALLRTASYNQGLLPGLAGDDTDHPPMAVAGVSLPETPWTLPVAGTMVMLSLWMAMANLALLQLARERWPSRQRWGAPMDQIDPLLFLGLAAAGATPAAWTALHTRHAGRQQGQLLPRLLNITGVQIGLLIGISWWWMFG